MAFAKLRTASRIALAATPATANLPTTLTTFVLTPVLQTLFLVGVIATARGSDIAAGTAAAIMSTAGVSMVTIICGTVARDRYSGTFSHDWEGTISYWGYWAGRVTLAAATSFVVGALSLIALRVFAGADASVDLIPLVGVLAVVVVSGAVVGVAVALMSFGARDPFVAPNMVGALLPLLVGVVVPLAAYPGVLQVLARIMPFTYAVDLARSLVGDPAEHAGIVGSALASVASEMLIAAGWLAVALLVMRWIIRRVRVDGLRDDVF